MGNHRVLAHAQGKLMRHPLHQPAGVDEYQGRVMVGRQAHDGVQGLPPNLVGGYRAQFRRREAYAQLHAPGVAGINDEAVGRAVRGDVPVAHQEAGHLLDGTLRRRQADPSDLLLGQGAQSLYGQGQVRAALVVGHGVDFVQDNGSHILEAAPAALRGEQDVQRFRRGNQDVRRVFRHLLALGLRRIAGAHRGSDGGQGQAATCRQRLNILQRPFKVLLDVVGQRLERRHVHHLGSVRQSLAQALANQLVNAGQEGGQGFAGAGGRGDEGVPSLGDGRPALALGRSRFLEPAAEPVLDDGMELVKAHGQGCSSTRV